MAADEVFYAAAERRVEYFTLGIGAACALCAGVVWGLKIGAGVGVGAVLSWINYRWMKQGVSTLASLSTAQAGAEKARVPASVYFKVLGRYALLAFGAYVILRGFRLPLKSVLAGFFVLVAAVLVELIGQLFRRGSQPRADS
jgi:ATP synthase I subunit